MKKASLSSILIAVILLAVAIMAEAQQPGKIPRIGLLMSSSTPETGPFIEAFRLGLRELGYIEGKNIGLEIRGEAKSNRLSDLATELVGLKVDIIVAEGNPAVNAAKQATSAIPIVMVVDFGPLESGFVTSLARPSGNITGLTSITRELSGKRLEVLLELVPGVKRVAVLAARADPARFMAIDEYKETEAAARALGVKLQVLSARDPDTIDGAFGAMTKERAQALIVMPSRSYVQNREFLIQHAVKNRLPSMYPHSIYAENGGLVSYGADFRDENRRLAIYKQPTKFELVINLRAAKQIGLTIPPNVLVRADRVIN